jgi:hypothetical protein
MLGVLVAGALAVLRLQSVPRASDFEGTDGVLLSDGSREEAALRER